MVKVASLMLSLLAVHGVAIAAPATLPASPSPSAPSGATPPASPSPSAPSGATASPAAAPALTPSPVVTLPVGSSSIGPPSEAAPAALPGAAPAQPLEEKSGLVAFSLTFTAPIAVVLAGGYLLDESRAQVGVIVLGAVLGPSTGWFYAGRYLPGLATTTARLVGGWLIVQSLDERAGASDGAPGLGAALFITATLVDWIGVPMAIGAHNARARAAVVPSAHPGGGGLSIVGAF